MSKERMRLLLQLEGIVGQEFYNANIQNWGAGGVWEGEGRDFRFPISFVDAEGQVSKTKYPKRDMPVAIARTGYYKLGANELHIMRALDNVLSFLEAKHDLRLGKK